MPDWQTVILSITASLLASITVSIMVTSRLRKSIKLILSSLRTYRDLQRASRLLSRKPRRRYIVFEVISEAPIDWDALEEEVKKVITEYLGKTGRIDSGVALAYYDPDRRRGVLRVRADYRYKVLGLLGLVRRVQGRKVLIIPLAVTGSVKRAKRIIRG